MNGIEDLETERDDAIAALSAVTRLFQIGAEAPSLNDAGGAIAEAVRAELAAEECAVCLRGPSGALMMIGLATQHARLGGPTGGTSTAGLVALGHLVAEASGPRCYAAAPDGGFSSVGFDALRGPGAVVLPFACGDSPGGLVLVRWLIAPPIRFGREAKFKLLATAVAQAIGVVRDREGRTRVVAALEGELGARAHQQNASTDRVTELASELMKANRAKQEFLATMSHELRTPLNAVLGFGGLLQEGAAGPLADQQQTMLERVLRSAHHLHALIDDILFFVECECDRVVVARESWPTAQLVAEVREALPATLTVPEVTFAATIAPAVERIVVDSNLCKRLLFHLVSNALKFTHEGRVELLIAPGDDETVVVTVRDTGVGISPPQLDRIFQAFTQGDGSSTRRFEGIGLGLTLVQRCAHLLGGAVRVESAAEVGTTVRVTLPGALGAAVSWGGGFTQTAGASAVAKHAE